MYRTLMTVLTVLLASVWANAQTPVEKIMIKYEDVPGAKSFVAQGLKMTLARNYLKSTQVAPIASDVDELYVLRMGGVSQTICLRFVSDLKSALKQYDYYGTQPSRNGEVEVYVHYSGPGTVDELVIYNPSAYSLNSLSGQFTVKELMALDRNGR